MYAHRAALDDPARRRYIDDLVLLINSVLEARRRVMLEVNASAACLDAVVAVLPSMRQATVACLFGNGGYAVKAAVPRELLPQVIPAVKAAGGTDVVVSTLSQIVP
jgi:ATP phosphoribosyltransferase-like protein